ncbi:methyltransferase domain-containing protein [Shewanella sp. 10N.286.51.B8]|uniref:methyltransferase domain-containing protein n=1 Tax=Shewanella sp. 10N.286.51.B8 TaxID=3229708 RepID=UPI003550894D
MNSILICPKCATALHYHQASAGYYCDNKHHIDKNAQGYLSFVTSTKFKGANESRQQLRSKRFLMAEDLFKPLMDKLSESFNQLIDGRTELQHLNFSCADGLYLRHLATSTNVDVSHWGVSEAENALFAASKENTPASLILTPYKKLPFADNSLDIVSLFDVALKGKECLRVLKDSGRLLMLVPGPRHLWQLKQQVYDNLAEKPLQLNLPKQIEVVNTKSISFTGDVSGEQAMTLLEMNHLAWRVNDQLKHQIKSHPVTGLEFDYVLITAKLTEAK